MVYLGILVTRKFLGSQKILTELTAIITQKMLCPRVFLRMHFHFSVKMSFPSLDRKCSVFYLSLYMGCTENLSLLHDLYLFCCFLVKSQVTESFLPFSMILFCKMANMFQYDRNFLLPFCKVTICRKFSASESDFFSLNCHYISLDRKFITSSSV